MKKQFNVKVSTPVLLSFVIVVVIVLELLAAYIFWYQNIEPAKVPVSNENVVRVNLTGYRKVIEFLGGLETYTPNEEAEQLGSPFIYR